jgi:flagellar protein FliO/FliZ
MRLFLSLIFFLLSATNVLAGGGAESPFSLSATLRLIWGLLIVLGALLVVYALAKKKLSFLNAGGGKGAITIIEMRHLMPRKSLCLIKVRGQEYLLGLGNDQINLIAVINPPDTKDFAATLATAESDNYDSPHDSAL